MANNPWDFSNIILQNQAGNIWGNAMANIGKTAGEDIKKYAEVKKQNQAAEGGIKSTLAFLEAAQKTPGLSDDLKKFANDTALKLHDPNLSLAERSVISSQSGQQIGQAMQLGQAAMQAQEQQRQIAMRQQMQAKLSGINLASTNPYIANNQSIVGSQNPAMLAAAQAYGATGDIPSAKDMMDFMGVQAQHHAKAEPISVDLGGGARAAFSPGTGAFSVLPQTPAQLGAAEAAKKEAELTTTSASTLLDNVSNTAESARSQLGAISRIEDLYKQGVTSGFLQPIVTQARSAFGRFGLGGEGLANQQQFEQQLNMVKMEFGKEMMKGGGSVSNFERNLITDATANPSLLPEANLKILGVMKQAANRSVKLQELRNSLEDQGKSKVEIAREIERARDKMPLVGIEDLAQYRVQKGADKESAGASNQSSAKGPASVLPADFTARGWTAK